ncbi:MAG TPA: twin-arginine translocase TatA/TatE family subunit [Vulgatibacter sp.]|nr:twin-arginine translocase TatA/TatE family subunit [Vulgatibacter sp.]
MSGMRMPELLIIFAVILILFGGSRIAGLGKALGSGIRNFKKGIAGEDGDEAAAGTTTPAEQPKA